MSEDESVTVYSSSDESLPNPPSYDELELGDTWRQAEIRRCQVCHTLTNKWTLGGYPSSGPRCYCPATRHRGETIYEQSEDEERHEKHQELEELLERREELEERLEQYQTTSAAGKRTQERLHNELEVLDEQITNLREWFNGRFNDVVGVDPAERKIISL